MRQATFNKHQENKNLHLYINAMSVNISSYEDSTSYPINQVFYSYHDSQQTQVRGYPYPGLHEYLSSKPVLFFGIYVDLHNKPKLYKKTYSLNNDDAL